MTDDNDPGRTMLQRRLLWIAIILVALGIACLIAALRSPADAFDPKDSNGSNAKVYTYMAPETDLEVIDNSLFDGMDGGFINMASFVFSDYRLMNALTAAAIRGTHIRIYLDPGELKHLSLTPTHPLVVLAQTPNVQVKVKARDQDLMHLKGYTINGKLLRTGSANFSMAGLKKQDNDLVLIYSSDAARRFDQHFATMWSRTDNQSLPVE